MRYRVLDLPARGVGAFTPTPFTPPMASSWGLVRRTGYSGTVPVPVPGATKVWAPTPNNAPQLQGSNNAPDFFLPDKYVAYADNMGPTADAGIGMAMRRHNPLPVPALSWISAVRKAMYVRTIGGRNAPAWPRAFQRWPTTRNTAGG